MVKKIMNYKIIPKEDKSKASVLITTDGKSIIIGDVSLDCGVYQTYPTTRPEKNLGVAVANLWKKYLSG